MRLLIKRQFNFRNRESSRAGVQRAVHEAGQSEECFQCPLVSSPDELGNRSSWTEETEGLPNYKKDMCSEAKKSEVLQRHFHPERGGPRKA